MSRKFLCRILWVGPLVLAGACDSDVPAVVGPYFDVPVSCDNFCSTVLRHCRGEWRQYASLEDCLNTCATWPNTPGVSFVRGHSLQCRFLYASMVTYVHDVASYCGNAGPTGGQSCHE